MEEQRTNPLAWLFGRGKSDQTTEMELAALRQELAALRKNSDRYLWLKANSTGQWNSPCVVTQHPTGRGVTYQPIAPDDMDAAIDAARR